MTTDVGEIDKLEQLNRKLKGVLGKLPSGLKTLRALRGITLEKENEALRTMLASVGELPRDLLGSGHQAASAVGEVRAGALSAEEEISNSSLLPPTKEDA